MLCPRSLGAWQSWGQGEAVSLRRPTPAAAGGRRVPEDLRRCAVHPSVRLSVPGPGPLTGPGLQPPGISYAAVSVLGGHLSPDLFHGLSLARGPADPQLRNGPAPGAQGCRGRGLSRGLRRSLALRRAGRVPWPGRREGLSWAQRTSLLPGCVTGLAGGECWVPLGEVSSGVFSEEATGGWVEAETPGSEGRLGRVAPAHPALLPRGPATGAKGSLVPLA